MAQKHPPEAHAALASRRIGDAQTIIQIVVRWIVGLEIAVIPIQEIFVVSHRFAASLSSGHIVYGMIAVQRAPPSLVASTAMGYDAPA